MENALILTDGREGFPVGIHWALHVIAMVQARRYPPAKAYIARKMVEGSQQVRAAA